MPLQSCSPLNQAFGAEGDGRPPRNKPEVPHEPTGAKNELDPKLEILEIFAKAKIDKIDNFWARSF